MTTNDIAKKYKYRIVNIEQLESVTFEGGISGKWKKVHVNKDQTQV